MDDNTRKLIELATVPVRSKSMKPGEGGQGVYIGNHFVLTAAHCLDFDTHSGNALGGYNIYYIDRPEGDPIWCSPVFIDPCSDLAVIGACDDQVIPERFFEFQRFFRDIAPIRIRRDPLPPGEPIHCEIRSHLGSWISGRMTQEYCEPFAFLEADENILGGTSGGPIVDDDGNIIAIVSTGGGMGEETTEARNSVPSLWLPPWLLEEVSSDD
jgi:hypothetical protein